MPSDLEKPWLVAAWPGMGGVALVAGNYLTRKLGMQPTVEIDPHAYYDVESIRIRKGIVQPQALPRSVLFEWRHPAGGHDLLVLLGEQQPKRRSDAYSSAVLDQAVRLGVERVFTFAAMATPVDPREPARVFAASTHRPLLDELRQKGAEILQEAEISGLNGSFLAAAAARGMEGVCLLGEFPFFASTIANPKASSAVLRVFTGTAGIELDRAELDADAARIERGLVEHLTRLTKTAGRAAAREQAEEEPEFPSAEEEEEEADEPTEPTPELEPEPEPEIPADVLARIEAGFAEVEKDRSKAMELKANLDRHGLFKRFEDRFLDLFKQGS